MMKTKNKFKVFFLTLLLVNFLLSSINITYAAASTITTGPGVPDQLPKYEGGEASIRQFLCAPTDAKSGSGAAENKAGRDLYDCINKLYKFAIVIASTLGMLFLVVAGWIYMSAEGNAESVDKAKNMLVSTLAALIILMSGYILLKAINPDLIQFRSIQPPSVTLELAKTPTRFNNTDIPASELASCTPSGTNSGGYYRFSQCSGSWANTPYGNCDTSKYGPSTIATSACGPSSLATVIYNYQQQHKIPSKTVDPGIIAKLSSDNNFRVCGNGTSSAMFVTIAAQYGLEAKQVPWDTAFNALQRGTPVIASMGPGYFTDVGHFVTLYGVDSGGNILVADSGPRNRTSATVEIVKSQIKYAFIIYPK